VTGQSVAALARVSGLRGLLAAILVMIGLRYAGVF
jgi:hypothetical protein